MSQTILLGSSRFKPVSAVGWREFDDYGVLVNVESGSVADLEGTSLLLWRSIVSKRSLDEMVSQISEQFELSTDTVREDVSAFLNKLLKERTIEFLS